MVRSNKIGSGFLLIFSILFIFPTVSLGEFNNESFELTTEAIGLMWDDQPEKALEYLDKSIAIDDNDSYTWALKGNTHSESGDFRKAIYAYLRSLYINPEQRTVWINKGNAHYRLGEYEKAAQSYEFALDLYPYDKMTWLLKGDALFYSGKYERAAEAYDYAIKLDPFFYEAIDKKKVIDDLIREQWVKNITTIVIIISILTGGYQSPLKTVGIFFPP